MKCINNRNSISVQRSHNNSAYDNTGLHASFHKFRLYKRFLYAFSMLSLEIYLILLNQVKLLCYLNYKKKNYENGTAAQTRSNTNDQQNLEPSSHYVLAHSYESSENSSKLGLIKIIQSKHRTRYFPRVSEAKQKAYIFYGPDIKEHMKDLKFNKSMEDNERSAWFAFKSTVTNILGNHRSPCI